MFLPNVLPDALLQFVEGPGPWRILSEQSAMDVLRTVSARTANNDSVAVFFPFENRTRPDAEFPANAGGD